MLHWRLGRGLAQRHLLHVHPRHVAWVCVPGASVHLMHVVDKLGRGPGAATVTVDDVLGLGDHLTRLHVWPALVLRPRHPLGRPLVLTTGLEGGGRVVHDLGGARPLAIVLLRLRHNVVRHAHVLGVVGNCVHVTLVRQHSCRERNKESASQLNTEYLLMCLSWRNTHLGGAPWLDGSSAGPWSWPAAAPGPGAGRWGTSGQAAAEAGRRSPGRAAGRSRGGCRYWTSSLTRGHTDHTPGVRVRGAESSKCGYLTCNRRMVRWYLVSSDVLDGGMTASLDSTKTTICQYKLTH